MALKMEKEFSKKLVTIAGLHRVPSQMAVIFIVRAVRSKSLTGLVNKSNVFRCLLRHVIPTKKV